MREFQKFLKQYGFILGPASLAALAAGFFRVLVLRAPWGDPWTIGLLTGGVLLGAGFILGNPTQVRTVLTKRGTRYGLNAAVMSIAFIAILIGLNYVAEQYYYRYDVTEAQKHTLSAQSKQVMAEINKPVTIIGFFTADDYGQRDAFQELLDQYLYYSNYLSYRIIDPDRDPLEARRYEEPYTGLLIQSGDRSERVLSASEQNITGAILKVTSEKPRIAYFLEGHGERSTEDSTDEGYSLIAEKLREQNYEVRSLSLAITDTVPSDASVVVIAGPEKPLLDEELTRLQAYLSGGGRALIMQDPFSGSNLNVILANWQVRFSNGIVVDPVSAYRYTVWPVPVSHDPYHPISKNLLENRLITILLEACGIEQGASMPAGVTYTPLFKTTEEGWIEMGTGENIQRDVVDTPGPVTLAASIESSPMFGGTGSSSKTRIVMIGDSDFATNGAMEIPGNGQLFLNAVNWLAEEEMLIAIGPKDTWRQPVALTDIGSNLIIFTIVAVVLAVVVVGLAVWVVRRQQYKIASGKGKQEVEQ
jgi:ABC-type uncharacterized transport system involved in gliding motility auxiliary subunit